MTEARQKLGTFFRDGRGEPENRPQIALASDEDRAIDLSGRACGALALGAGLGFPVGDSAPLRFHPQPPTYDSYLVHGRKCLAAACADFMQHEGSNRRWFSLCQHRYNIQAQMK